MARNYVQNKADDRVVTAITRQLFLLISLYSAWLRRCFDVHLDRLEDDDNCVSLSGLENRLGGGRLVVAL